MYCSKCNTEMFGGSICHLCGGILAESEETAEVSPSKGGVKIITRKKRKVTKEFGQTVLGRLGRLAIEILLFCAGFVLLSIAVVHVANWLSTEMALDQQRVRLIDIHSRWMTYFWFVGCGVVVFLTVRLRFKPGK
jgi:hypothetical protein